MMRESIYPVENNRIVAIDLLRGVAVLFLIFHVVSYDLSVDILVDISPLFLTAYNDGIFGAFIYIFMFCSGFVSYLQVDSKPFAYLKQRLGNLFAPILVFSSLHFMLINNDRGFEEFIQTIFLVENYYMLCIIPLLLALSLFFGLFLVLHCKLGFYKTVILMSAPFLLMHVFNDETMAILMASLLAPHTWIIVSYGLPTTVECYLIFVFGMVVCRLRDRFTTMGMFLSAVGLYWLWSFSSERLFILAFSLLVFQLVVHLLKNVLGRSPLIFLSKNSYLYYLLMFPLCTLLRGLGVFTRLSVLVIISTFIIQVFNKHFRSVIE